MTVQPAPASDNAHILESQSSKDNSEASVSIAFIAQLVKQELISRCRWTGNRS